MPRSLIRPTKEELAALSAFIRVATADPTHRWRAVAVEAWAQGRSTRAAAAEANALFEAAGEPTRGNQTAASRAIRLYRLYGVEAFRMKKPRPGGRAPVPAEKVAMVTSTLRAAFAKGEVLTYASVAKQVGISSSKVARIAQAAKLDAKSRRGPVAGTGRPGEGGATQKPAPPSPIL